MTDAMFVVLTVVFFLIAGGYVIACERLGRK